jgi:hypothetical protein
MPGSWDPKVYRDRAQQWRDAADKLPPGEARDAYASLAQDYEKLAILLYGDAAAKKPEPPAS